MEEKDLVPIRLLMRLGNKNAGEITARPMEKAQALIAKGAAELYRPEGTAEKAGAKEVAPAPKREGNPKRTTRMVNPSVEK